VMFGHKYNNDVVQIVVAHFFFLLHSGVLRDDDDI